MPTLLEFCRKLAWQLINNNIRIGEQEGEGRVLSILHSSIDECTKARENISETGVYLH